MPFPSNEIIARFREGAESGRLGHAYLISGPDPGPLQGIAEELAAIALGAPAEDHPDFHQVRPESKSRRITVDQIRSLERSLYLKAFQAPRKVAVIQAAERMCLGQAEAANAFLKTLEEPPNRTLLLLTSSRPQMILPTILSRCLRLDQLAVSESDETAGDLAPLLQAWFQPQYQGAAGAYERAESLRHFWRQRRADLEGALKENQDESLSDEALQAMIEGEFQLVRAESVAGLQRAYWKRSRQSLDANGSNEGAKESLAAIRSLEELQQALQTNVNQDLAVERACLAVAGLV